MGISIYKNIVRFVFLVLLQILLLNNVQLGGFVNPYLYVLFILLLPFEIQGWLLLLFSFGLGLAVDVFEGGIGVNITACLVTGYCRPFVLRLLAPRDGYLFNSSPTIGDMGAAWILSYSGILLLIHHLTLFFAEAFQLSDFFYTILRATLSFIFTLFLVFLSHLLIYKKRETT